MEQRFEVYLENPKTGKRKWIDLPKYFSFDQEELEGFEDYRIIDVRGFPKHIKDEILSSNVSLDELNSITEYTSYYPYRSVYAVLEVSNNLEEAKQILERGDFVIYHGIHTMEDVAYEFLSEVIPQDTWKLIEDYIDYKKFGRDLELEGDFRDSTYGIVCITYFK